MSPSIGVSPSSRPMSVPHIGQPMMKARVPSIGIDDPAEPRVRPRRAVLLADEAVIWPALRDGRGDDPLGGLVGFSDGVEGARAGFVGDVERLTEVGPDGRSGGVGQRVGEIDEVAKAACGWFVTV